MNSLALTTKGSSTSKDGFDWSIGWLINELPPVFLFQVFQKKWTQIELQFEKRILQSVVRPGRRFVRSRLLVRIGRSERQVSTHRLETSPDSTQQLRGLALLSQLFGFTSVADAEIHQRPLPSAARTRRAAQVPISGQLVERH